MCVDISVCWFAVAVVAEPGKAEALRIKGFDSLIEVVLGDLKFPTTLVKTDPVLY